jgi:hypothetical protein
MTIPTVCQAYDSQQSAKPSMPGTASGKPQPKALPLQPPLRLLKAQLFWHSTSFYESQKGPWQCSYEPERMASMPSYIRHACHQSFPHYAAVGLATKQQNTSSSTAAIFQLQGMPLETTRAAYQTTNS